MKTKKVYLLVFLLLLTDVFSEKLSINSKPTLDRSPWLISNDFELSSNYSQTIAIPFSYPFEASLAPSNSPMAKESLAYQNFPTQSMVSFSYSQSATSSSQPSENSKIITYKSNHITDQNHYLRDTNSRIPSIWNSNSFANNTSSGVVFVYLKKSVGFNLDLSMRMMGNEAGFAILDSVTSTFGVSYSLDDVVSYLNPNYKMNFVLQYSNTQYGDDRIIPKKLDFSKSSLRSQFLSSGFTVNAKSLMFEGLIRLPVQQQAIFDLDGLLRPELQGRLGMKWYLPEYIKP